MSPLLSIEHVSKAYSDGRGRLTVLDHVSFEVLPAAQVGLYGPARSGKSTLLRIAVGIERPDSGSVRFEGRELTHMRAGARARLLRRSVGYLAMSDWRPNPGEDILGHVVTALGSDGFTPPEARRKALRALDSVEIDVGSRGTSVPIASLSAGDRTRVALARAIVREPRLLVVDEPARMPSLEERDRFCTLLRGVAREHGIALLNASAEMAALQGMDVMMSISAGGLRSSAPRRQATVLRLPTRLPPDSSGGAPTAGAARPFR
jgi:predicted ABC-type transport system involved in lysophospholipase L1 biosynthesis ATPase subunit